MKKSIEINLGGRIFNIDEDAYELLNSYIEELRVHFKDNEECEEIVADIELRLGELCEARMAEGRARIVDYAMIVEFTARMGRPESFDGEGVSGNETDAGETQDSATAPDGGTREPWRDAMLLGKKYYRDLYNRVLGGIFGGLSAYSGINVWLLRVAAILLTLFVFELFVPVAYLIAWMALPAAKSIIDRMRMREIKPMPGESNEDAWRREYERSTAEVLNNAGVSENKGCLGGCIVSLLLLVLLPLILLVLFMNAFQGALWVTEPFFFESSFLNIFTTYKIFTIIIIVVIVLAILFVVYYVMRNRGGVSAMGGWTKIFLAVLLLLAAALTYVVVDTPKVSFNHNVQAVKYQQTTVSELTDFVEKLCSLAKSPEIEALKDYFLLADNYAYSKKCTRILWHYIPSATGDSVFPFVSECTELDDKLIWKLMPRDEWVDNVGVPASVSRVEIVAHTEGNAGLCCLVDTAAKQMWIDLARCNNPGNVRVEMNSIPGWQVEVAKTSLPAEKYSTGITLSLDSYRDVKIVKGLPKLTIRETINGVEEKKEVLHTIYRTRELK